MSTQSPQPAFGIPGMGATAIRRLVDAADFVHDNRGAILGKLAQPEDLFSKRWIALIDSATQSDGYPIWRYSVKPVALTIPRSAGGLVNATVTTRDTGDAQLAGYAYNIRELLGTTSASQGIDLSALPGDFAMGPVVGLVECFFVRLDTGDALRVFQESNPIDGSCDG